jgi:hypothetical protein
VSVDRRDGGSHVTVRVTAHLVGLVKYLTATSARTWRFAALFIVVVSTVKADLAVAEVLTWLTGMA